MKTDLLVMTQVFRESDLVVAILLRTTVIVATVKGGE